MTTLRETKLKAEALRRNRHNTECYRFAQLPHVYGLYAFSPHWFHIRHDWKCDNPFTVRTLRSYSCKN